MFSWKEMLKRFKISLCNLNIAYAENPDGTPTPWGIATSGLTLVQLSLNVRREYDVKAKRHVDVYWTFTDVLTMLTDISQATTSHHVTCVGVYSLLVFNSSVHVSVSSVRCLYSSIHSYVPSKHSFHIFLQYESKKNTLVGKIGYLPNRASNSTEICSWCLLVVLEKWSKI